MTRNYAVGKWKPPVHTRFKKGQSGNPSGRPKGKVTIADADAVFDQVLNALVPVNENGRSRKISKIRALFTRTINEALKGHHPSAKLVLDHVARRQPQAEADQWGGQSKTDDEAKQELEKYLNEMRARMSGDEGAPSVQNDNPPVGLHQKSESEGDGASPKGE